MSLLTIIVMNLALLACQLGTALTEDGSPSLTPEKHAKSYDSTALPNTFTTAHKPEPVF